MIHKGGLAVSVDAALSDLTSVSGRLSVRSGATLTAPQLTSISGDLYMAEGATLTAPQLTSISGDLYVHDGATLTAPQLTSVSYLEVYDGATLTAPQLTSVDYMDVYDGAKLTTPLLTSVYGQRGREIARCPDEGYVLWLTSNGLYYAGCRRGLTRDEALAHWSDDNPRARLFTAAILNT
jgi:hypothetical protein